MLLSSIWAGSSKGGGLVRESHLHRYEQRWLVLAVGAAGHGWENTKYYRILLNIAVIISSGRAGHNVKQDYHGREIPSQ